MKKNKTKVGNGRGDRAQHDWAKMSAGGGGIHLDEADRRQRQKASAMHAIRQMIKGHRHLFGEEITDVKHLFHAIDTDRGGTIERGEWDAALTRLGLGLSPMQLSELWAGLDADGNGVIDYSELASEISPKHSRPSVSSSNAHDRSSRAHNPFDEVRASPGARNRSPSPRSPPAKAGTPVSQLNSTASRMTPYGSNEEFFAFGQQLLRSRSEYHNRRKAISKQISEREAGMNPAPWTILEQDGPNHLAL